MNIEQLENISRHKQSSWNSRCLYAIVLQAHELQSADHHHALTYNDVTMTLWVQSVQKCMLPTSFRDMSS